MVEREGYQPVAIRSSPSKSDFVRFGMLDLRNQVLSELGYHNGCVTSPVITSRLTPAAQNGSTNSEQRPMTLLLDVWSSL